MWMLEDMLNGLGDAEDYKVSVVIDNLRQKGKKYENRIFQAYLQEAKSYHHPFSYVALGHFYRFAIGVSQDHIRAMQYYIKASALGYKPVLIHLARRFRLGEGVEVDYNRAVNCCFSCIDEKCDSNLLYAIISEIIKIYCRINDSRFTLAYDDGDPGYLTVDEQKVAAVLDKVGAELRCSFDYYPKKRKRLSDKEIYLNNMKKLKQIIKAIPLHSII